MPADRPSPRPSTVRSRPIRRILACGLLLAACSERPDPDGDDLADALRMRYGRAENAVVSLRVLVEPPEADLLLFSIRAWCAADGTSRLEIGKYGVEFLAGAVAPDGSFRARLPDRKRTVRGDLAELDRLLAGRGGGGAFLANIRLLLDDLHAGPVPPDTAFAAAREDGAVVLTGTDPGGATLRLVLDASRKEVLRKEIRRDGEPFCRIDYDRPTELDRRRRPTRIELRIAGDPTGYTIRLDELDAVPAIVAEDLAVTLPEDWPELPLADFARLLVE